MDFIVPRDSLNPRALDIRPDPGALVVTAEEYQVWRQAHDMLQAAREQAARIVADAREAYDRECRRGYAEGEEEARLGQAEKMIESVGRTVDYLARVEHEIIDLVMAAVRKIVDDFDDREKVLMVVRNALAIMRNQKQITLRLNPADLDGVRDRVNALLAAFPAIGYIDMVADGRLERGACIVESEIGMIEASLEGQIEAMRSAFQRVLGSRV